MHPGSALEFPLWGFYFGNFPDLSKIPGRKKVVDAPWFGSRVSPLGLLFWQFSGFEQNPWKKE
ncbi:MAG: hypothetical protein SAJ37_03260, partial [Oscillatoria sp. PMC 1068.18]|nr:hypothetical protein [Oscillatoria sp. PMC 1068.18]